MRNLMIIRLGESPDSRNLLLISHRSEMGGKAARKRQFELSFSFSLCTSVNRAEKTIRMEEDVLKRICQVGIVRSCSRGSRFARLESGLF